MQGSGAVPGLEGVERMLVAIEDTGYPYAGGSAAALSAALAAALVTMTARVSRSWEAAPGVAAQARALRHRLVTLAHDDAEAFAAATAALATGEERGRTPLGVVLARAADAPLAIARAAADVAELAALAAEGSTPAVRPDAIAAAALAEAAATVAAHLVEVNLSTLPGDERRLAAAFARADAADARERAAALAG